MHKQLQENAKQIPLEVPSCHRLGSLSSVFHRFWLFAKRDVQSCFMLRMSCNDNHRSRHCTDSWWAVNWTTCGLGSRTSELRTRQVALSGSIFCCNNPSDPNRGCKNLLLVHLVSKARSCLAFSEHYFHAFSTSGASDEFRRVHQENLHGSHIGRSPVPDDRRRNDPNFESGDVPCGRRWGLGPYARAQCDAHTVRKAENGRQRAATHCPGHGKVHDAWLTCHVMPDGYANVFFFLIYAFSSFSFCAQFSWADRRWGWHNREVRLLWSPVVAPQISRLPTPLCMVMRENWSKMGKATREQNARDFQKWAFLEEDFLRPEDPSK